MMKFDFQIKRLGSIDVSGLKHMVEKETDDEWNKVCFRQENCKSCRSTKTIVFMWYDWKYKLPSNEVTSVTMYPNHKKYIKVIEPIHNFVSKFYPSCTIVRSVLTRLDEFSEVEPHIDHPGSWYFNRIHIPVITNPSVIFSVGDEVSHFGEGEVFEINNCINHWCKNNSPEKRVHLMIDLAHEYYIPKGVTYEEAE